MKKVLLIPVTTLLVLLLASTAGAAGPSQLGTEIRLWHASSPGQGTLLYTIGLGRPGSTPVHRIWEGASNTLPQTLFNNIHYFKGLDRSTPQFTFSKNGRRVHLGANESGEPLYFFQPVGRLLRVHRGANPTGTILYTITSDRVFAGPDTTAPIVLSANGDLTQLDPPVAQVVTILLESEPTLEEPD